MQNSLDELPFSNLDDKEFENLQDNDYYVQCRTPDSFTSSILTNSNMLPDFFENYNLNDFLLLHLNTRSLSKNFNELHELICSMQIQPDIVGITETKLNVNSNLDLVHISGYKFYSCNSLSFSGGVAIHAKNSLQIKIRNDINLYSIDFESIWIETSSVNDKNSTLIGVVAFYL